MKVSSMKINAKDMVFYITKMEILNIKVISKKIYLMERAPFIEKMQL